MRRYLAAGLMTGLAFLGPAASGADAQLSCAALAGASGFTGTGLGAHIGSRMGIAALGTAIPGTLPVGAVGAFVFAASALIACTMPYWSPAVTVSVLELLTAIGATALVTAIISYFADLPETARSTWRWARRRFIEFTSEPVTAYDWHMGYELVEWPAPRPHRTATSATLYPPPYSDPDELLEYLRRQLQR